MNDRLLALLTSKLIDRCGGLNEASAACEQLARPYSVTQLSRCQTVGSGCFLPIDIVAALESYCGDPVVSGSLAERASVKVQTADLLASACEAAEEGSDVLRVIRAAIRDGKLTRREIRLGMVEIQESRAALNRTEAALEAAEKAL